MPHLPRETLWIAAGLLGLLTLATLIGALLARRAGPGNAAIANLNQRTRSWWWMVALFVAAASLGRGVSACVFGAVSFLALREMLTLSPTRRGDHRTLFWVFFVVTPLQYAFVYDGWYGMFAVFVPVWVFLFVAVRCALAGDTRRYHERVAKIQWALMTCVYFTSHAPMLLGLEIAGFEGRNLNLLFYLALVVQLSDILQYVWGKLAGRHPVVPKLSPKKTWEGLIGGAGSAALIGMGLWWMTPFTPLESLGMSLAIVAAGFFGGLCMSAVKRDAGVKDWSHLIPGHGGVLDRIDSLCFAAPVFFHLTRYWFA
ncbi:MAG: phosphatidate cytidylyltransferase [Planctomycetes bacterium]|nr:phosphatidate cytidylyltransferase [Planctomycetota bacterium]